MMKDVVSDGSTLQVGDILAEFFAKKLEEMEEVETGNSSDKDSGSDSKFCDEKSKKKTKKKKHKHKKSKKKIKSKHSGKHKHSHKNRKRKHKDDDKEETHRYHKRHKLEEYEEKCLTSVEEEESVVDDIALLHSENKNKTVVNKTSPKYASTTDESIETSFKLSEIISETSSAIAYISTESDGELKQLHEKENENFTLQSTNFEQKYDLKSESLGLVENNSQIDKDARNENCKTLRTEKVRDYNKENLEHANSTINDFCSSNVASSSLAIFPISDSVSLTFTSNSLPTSTIKTNNSDTVLVTGTSNGTTNMSAASNSTFSTRTLGSKSRGKIVIKDLSCCQILQQVSEKEKDKMDSLEEGEISSEEEIHVPKEESQAESSEELSFYNLIVPKEKKPKRKREKHKHKKKKKKHLRRSRSNENERYHQHERKHPKTSDRPRSSSPQRESYDLREKIDKARLLKVAQKNVLLMIEQGTLPKGVKIDALKQEQLLAMRTGGKSVQEFTDFCRALSQKDQDESSSDISQDKWNEDTEMPFIHHPFKLREHQPTIKLNIKNAIQLPIKSPAEKVADAARLRTQFPVSSGSQHRIKELQWIPVEKNNKQTSKQVTPSTSVVSNSTSPSVVPAVSNIVESSPNLTVSTIGIHNPLHTALPTAYVQPIQQKRNVNVRNQDHDISTIVAERLRAVRRLQENENDVEALNKLYKVQKKMQEWVQSKQLPGQYTGHTDVRMLSPEELSGPVPVWAKKDQFIKAMPVTEGIGMHLLRKMGWNPGEGLGKNKEGALEPLLLDIKTDKRGLISNSDVSKNILSQPIKKDLSGKHPVSVLMELCSKRKWGFPVFELIDENGPDHRKTFLFKVKINNVEYQPTCSSPNKKHAKAQAATVCLQALGLVPRDLKNPL